MPFLLKTPENDDQIFTDIKIHAPWNGSAGYNNDELFSCNEH
jgi:hypothetical protein